MAILTNNAAAIAGNGIGPRTRIINLAKTNMTQAELDAALLYLAAGDVAGTNDAHTIAGVSVLTEDGVFTSGTTDNVSCYPRHRCNYSWCKLWYRYYRCNFKFTCRHGYRFIIETITNIKGVVFTAPFFYDR